MSYAQQLFYGTLGLIIGLLLGILAASLVPITSVLFSGTFYVLPLSGALVGAYAGWQLGRRLSNREIQPGINRGNFFVANRLAGIFILFSAVVGIGFGFILPSLFENEIASFLFSIVMNVAASWVGVWYVARRKYLGLSHKPSVIAGWVVGYFAIYLIGFFLLTKSPLGNDIPRILINGVVVYAAIYFFCKRALSQKM